MMVEMKKWLLLKSVDSLRMTTNVAFFSKTNNITINWIK